MEYDQTDKTGHVEQVAMDSGIHGFLIRRINSEPTSAAGSSVDSALAVGNLSTAIW